MRLSKLFRRERRPTAELDGHREESRGVAPGFHDDASGIADMDERFPDPKVRNGQRIDWLINFALGAALVALGYAVHGCFSASH